MLTAYFVCGSNRIHDSLKLDSIALFSSRSPSQEFTKCSLLGSMSDSVLTFSGLKAVRKLKEKFSHEPISSTKLDFHDGRMKKRRLRFSINLVIL